MVIGRRARDVAHADALDHVFGYAVMNDVTARDMQRAEPQWVRAKGGDGFGPFGPWVTTRDEVPDPQALGIRTRVNGDLRQDASTAGMAFGSPTSSRGAPPVSPWSPATSSRPAPRPASAAAACRRCSCAPATWCGWTVDGLGAIENAIR